MYEAQPAKYVRIYVSIEFRSLVDLKYTKLVHVLQGLIQKITIFIVSMGNHAA